MSRDPLLRNPDGSLVDKRDLNEALNRALHPVIKNVQLAPDVQRTLDAALNLFMEWAARTFVDLDKPPEITAVGFKLQANTVTFTLQRKAPAS